jgi:hypothetical protein
MSSKQRADEAFQRQAALQKRLDQILGGSGWAREVDTNFALGRNVLREELGEFGDWEGASYALDQATRDRLLAHAREDAAASAAMAKSAFREAYNSAASARRAVLLIGLSLALNVAALAFGVVIWLNA